MNRQLNRRTVVKIVAASAAMPSVIAAANGRKTVEIDVCVLGAGASGMYTAMRLRDLGYSVAVVEKSDRIGGHAYTYRAPNRDGFQDMGVRIYPDVSIIKKTFKRYGIPLRKIDLKASKRVFVDIESGEESEFKEPSGLEIAAALIKYDFLIRTKFGFLPQEGLKLPRQVPEELLQPFGDFLKGHEIDTGYAPVTHYLQGYGPIRSVPTIYALKNMRPAITENILFNSFVMPVHGASDIYNAMAKEFGKDIILNAALEQVVRTEGQKIDVSLSTPHESIVIKANQLVVSYAPMQKAMQSFDLDETESELFSKFKTNNYWTALLRVDGFPANHVYFNVATQKILEGQKFPGMYTAVPAGIEGMCNVLFGSETDLPDDEVKARIVGDLENMSKRAIPGEVTVRGFETFAKHSPFGVTVDVEEIRNGFYDRMLALQGKRHTYYVGAAIDTNDTSSVWAHAEKMVGDHF